MPPRRRSARPPSCSALPPADPLGVDDRHHLEGAPVRGARGRDHLVGYARPAPGQKLLQSGLEVDPGLGGELDPRLERRRPPRPRCARSRRRRSRRRSAPRSPPAAAARLRAGPRPGSPSPTPSGSFARSISGTPSCAADLGAGDAADRLVVDLGQAARGERREASRRRSVATARPRTLSPRKARRSKESTRRSVQEEWVSAWRRRSSGSSSISAESAATGESGCVANGSGGGVLDARSRPRRRPS